MLCIYVHEFEGGSTLVCGVEVGSGFTFGVDMFSFSSIPVPVAVPTRPKA